MADDPDAREEITEIVADRTLGLGVLVVGWLVLAPPLFTASREDRPQVGVLVALVAAVAALIAVWSPLPRRTPVTVTRDGDALLLTRAGRQRRVRRAQIDRVELQSAHHGKHEVVLVQRWRSVRLEVADREAALALVGRVVGPRPAARFWALSPLLASVPRGCAALAGCGVAGALVSSVFPLIGPLVVLVFLALVFAPRRVIVGNDGVELRWLSASRYVRLTDINHLSVFGETYVSLQHTAVVGRAHGESIILPMMSRTAARALSDAVASGAARRMAGDTAVHVAPRGERAHVEWVAELRKHDAAGLRSQAIPKDELWRLIDDPSAQPIDRASAAVALGTRLSAQDRQRLAEVGETVAAPKLRVVLERSPDAEDAALGAMLETLEATTSRR